MANQDVPTPFVLDDRHLKGVPKEKQEQAEKDYKKEMASKNKEKP